MCTWGWQQTGDPCKHLAKKRQASTVLALCYCLATAVIFCTCSAVAAVIASCSGCTTHNCMHLPLLCLLLRPSSALALHGTGRHCRSARCSCWGAGPPATCAPTNSTGHHCRSAECSTVHHCRTAQVVIAAQHDAAVGRQVLWPPCAPTNSMHGSELNMFHNAAVGREVLWPPARQQPACKPVC
jgi:hypothetical protein